MKRNCTSIVTKMTKLFLFFCLTIIINCQIIEAQCINRQPTYNVINEAMVETPRNHVTQQGTTNFVPQNTLIESLCTSCNSVHQFPSANVLPGPITIITDYSPSICKNLADTLQIMTVCNLLQSSKGPTDVVLQLVSPILNEVLSSPSFSCGCKNPLYANPNISPSDIIAPVFNPSVITSNFITTQLSKPTEGACSEHGLFPNIVSLLRNSF